ncbi:hypothetical protein JZU48_01000, partial [bacterium]|nr:hypothetical protein [bacterium]
MSVEDLSQAITLQEAGRLIKVPGIGKKTAERLLLALTLAEGTPAAKAMKDGGVNAQSLNAAIEDVRKGRTADTASAEQSYDALKRYT